MTDSSDLNQTALSRRLAGPEAQQTRAVAKAVSRDVIEEDFDHQLRPQGRPMAGALGGPAARAAGFVAGEARLALERLEPPGQGGLVRRRQAGGEANVVEEAGVVVKPKQERAQGNRVNEGVTRD